MNFSDVTTVTIPQGDVSKITDASGQVLWEKNKIVLKPVWNVKHVASVINSGSPATSTISCVAFRLSGNNGYNVILRDTETNRNGDTITNTVATNNKLYTLSVSKPAIGTYPFLVKNVGNSRLSSTYALVPYYALRENNYTTIPCVPINATPISDTSVSITGSPERGEYLLTGFTSGLAVVKTNATTAPTFHSSSLTRTCWASGLGTSGLYFGITGNDGNVSYSPDGITWQTSTVHTASNGSKIVGIEYLSKRNQVRTISTNSKNLAFSSDGVTWKYNQAPSNSSLCAYDPEHDVFCIWSNSQQKAYVTKDFSTWEEASMPNSATYSTLTVSGTVNLRDLGYERPNSFVGYEHLGQRVCYLSIV